MGGISIRRPGVVKSHPVYSHIWGLVHEYDRSFLGVAIGSPGTGKSTSCLRFLYDLDRDKNGKSRFSIDRVVFEPKEFLRLMKAKMPKGSAILWDEVGVAIPKREWYSLRNRLVSSVFQTMRFKNRIVLMTLPSLDYSDSQIGPLVNGLIQMDDMNTFSGNVAYARYSWVQYNAKYRHFYYKRPRGFESGLPTVYSRWAFHKPNPELVAAYKAKQEEAKQTIIEHAEDLISYMAKYVGKNQRLNLTEAELYELVKANLHDYLDAAGEKIVSALVMVKNKGLDYRTVARVVKALNIEIEKGDLSV